MNMNLTKLPDNLQVGGDLDLRDAKIDELPGKYPYMRTYTEDEMRKIINDKGGKIGGRIYGAYGEPFEY